MQVGEEGSHSERDSLPPFILQCWIRPFLRMGARRIGVEKFGVQVVAYLVGGCNSLLDGIRLELSSWSAHARLGVKFAGDVFASPISVAAA